MFINGNAKVGEAQVYTTKKELDQQKQIEKLKQLLSKAMFPNDELQAEADKILKGKE